MLEYAIVGLIVAAAAFYAARKFMPALNSDPGCGSGCDTCNACDDPEPAPADGKRVIKIHKP